MYIDREDDPLTLYDLNSLQKPHKLHIISFINN